MTVSTLSTRIEYAGDGTATDLPVPFPFFAETDLEVIEVTIATQSEEELVLNIDYTVTGGDGSTGTVVPASVRPTTVSWRIQRRVAITQGVDLTAGGLFDAESVETALDRLTLIAQDVDEMASRIPTVLAPPAGTTNVSAFMATVLLDTTASLVRADIDAQQDVITTRGDLVRGDATGSAERLPVGSPGQVVRFNNPDSGFGWLQLPDLNTHFRAKGLLHGLKLSNGTDTANDIDIATGMCRDDTNAALYANLATLTKRMDETWVEGTNLGGRPTAVSYAANTWYHVFLIVSQAYGTVDAGFDTSLTATNLIAESSYQYYRRIGSVLTNATPAIVQFIQDGDDYWWLDPPRDQAAVSVTATASNLTLSVPPDVNVKANMNIIAANPTASFVLYLSSPNVTDEAAHLTNAPLGLVGLDVQSSSDWYASQMISVRTNTSKQIRARSNHADTTLSIATLGWTDSRGKNV